MKIRKSKKDWLGSQVDLSRLNQAFIKVSELAEFLVNDSEIINRNLLMYGSMIRVVTKAEDQ